MDNKHTVSDGSLSGEGGGSDYTYGVCSSNNIKVSGDGSLSGTSSRYGVYGFGINVEDGSLSGSGNYGVYVNTSIGNGIITISGGEVLAQGNTRAFNKQPTIVDTLAPYDADDNLITNPNYTSLKYVHIKEAPTFTVTIDAGITNGTVKADRTTVPVGATVTLTIEPSTGYELASLTVMDAKDNDVAVSGTGTNRTFTMPADDVTVTAQWKVNQYTISFDSNGGTVIDPITLDYNTAVEKPGDPTKEGYTFAGWDPAIPATMPAEDITLTAQWKINQYTISFDSDGGTVIDPITLDYNTAVEKPADPTKTGFDFGGWYADSGLTTAYVFGTMPAENITVYAKWTPAIGIAYTVKHYHQNASGSGYTLYESETLRGTTNAETAAEAKNYPGFTEQTFTQTTILPDGTAVVEIKYDRNTYTVTLVTNRGTIRDGDVTEYTYGVGAKLPTNVTRSGYYFSGWYDNEDCKGIPVTEITTRDIGNKTFYAKWTYLYANNVPSDPTYPPVVNDGNNGDVVVRPKNPEKGDTVTITPDPDKGYEVDEVIITDKKGKPVPVVDNGDGTYSFKQPSGKVIIEVTFKKIVKLCPGDKTCPMYGYTDLDRTAWYHDGVHFAIENGLMNGIGDNQFNPNGTTTRAMIVTILWRLEGSPVVNYAMDFEDVATGQWYTEAIRWAASKKIVEGYGNGKFGTNDVITREQFVTIMFRYAKYKGYDVSVGENTNILSYDDAFDVADWAIPAMQWACGEGLIQGIADGNKMNLAPQSNATRVQAATILYRFVENVTKED